MTARGRRADDFDRLHRAFLHHLGFAVALAWFAALVAATHAPWTRNIRGLLDPLAMAEGTGSYLFGLPLVLTLGWLGTAFGADAIRRSLVLRNQALEFALAGAAAFAVFCMAISRAVTAYSLGA